MSREAADALRAWYDRTRVSPAVPVAPTPSAAASTRQLKLTPASSIRIRPVKWLWLDRLALGSLALLAGREGIGKSTVAYTIAADITRGQLPGVYRGQRRPVIVAATEDSWEHTIAPRLIAAGADLNLVYRVDVTTSEGVNTGPSLPRDLPGLEQEIQRVHAGLVLLDPLMSRLDSTLDTHKDADVRLALEPLVALADRCRVTVLGIIHVSKSSSSDPLTTVMGSRAFAAVARAVLFVMADPDDDTIRMLGQPKNNLGRSDLPTLTFQVEGVVVAETEDGPIVTGRVRWLGETDRQIREVLESAGETSDARSAVGEAAGWLLDYLTSVGGTADSATIKVEGKSAGHSQDALKRARPRIKAVSESTGFPRRTYWRLPDPFTVGPAPVGATLRETAPTAPTAPTGLGESSEEELTTTLPPSVRAVGAVGAVGGAPPRSCSHCGEPLDRALITEGESSHTGCGQGAA